jgi:prepilin-type N-terminal cleavage/methylation domain-containing protein
MPAICSAGRRFSPGQPRGTTLLELALVVAILAVLLGLAYPSWQRFRAHQSLRYGAAQVATDLREAQERAKAERKEYRVTFTAGSAEYTVERVGGGFTHRAELPPGVTLSRGAVVSFTAYGRPNETYSIELVNSAGTATVTVSGGGGIQYSAP